MKVFLYVLPLFLLMLSHTIHCAPKLSNYTHIQLVQTWPRTFCLRPQVTCKTPLPQGFTLHGLWPADSNGSTVRKCSKNEPDPSLYTKLGKNLTAAWPSITNVDDDKFWNHEWCEHGSCSESQLDAERYFRAAIREKNKINMLKMLKAANINPSNSTSVVYPKSAIENAVIKGIGSNITNVYVSCSTYNKTDLLFEIYICLDPTATKYISCPKNNDTRGCGGVKRRANIKFPVR